MCLDVVCVFFFFKQKTAYEMLSGDWSSDVCSSDLGVLQGVVQEVEKRTRDRFAVHDYRWNVAGNVLLEGKSILLDLKAVGLQSRMNQFGEVGFLELVFLASRLNSGEVQDVVNECRQALALLSYDAEVLLIFVLGHKPPELQGLGIQPDQGQGRPQFM